MRNVRMGRFALAMLSTLTVLTVATASPATAANTTAAASGTDPAIATAPQRVAAGQHASTITLRTSFSRPAGGGTTNAAAPAVINCTAHSDNPHNSTHVPGTVNVIGKVECTSAVATIDLVVGLLRGNTVVAAEPRVEQNVPSTSRRAAAPCVSGTYFGVADAFVVPPPGYQPRFAFLVHSSPGVPITC